jgi:hypothetical protein
MPRDIASDLWGSVAASLKRLMWNSPLPDLSRLGALLLSPDPPQPYQKLWAMLYNPRSSIEISKKGGPEKKLSQQSIVSRARNKAKSKQC